MRRTGGNKIGMMLAIALLGVLGLSACKQDSDEGQWIRLPGGQMVYGRPGKPETIERLIYRIDDHRYFTMMVSEDYSTCGSGTAWYHDTKRGIDSEIGPFNFVEKRIFVMQPDQYLGLQATPVDIGGNPPFYLSKDFGKTWHKTSLHLDAANAGVYKNYVFVVNRLDGVYPYTNEQVHFVYGVRVWGLSKFDEYTRDGYEDTESPDAPGPQSEYFPYQNPDTDDVVGKDTIIGEDNIKTFIDLKTPSGWSHFRCDPMPKKPAAP